MTYGQNTFNPIQRENMFIEEGKPVFFYSKSYVFLKISLTPSPPSPFLENFHKKIHLIWNRQASLILLDEKSPCQYSFIHLPSKHDIPISSWQTEVGWSVLQEVVKRKQPGGNKQTSSSAEISPIDGGGFVQAPFF